MVTIVPRHDCWPGRRPLETAPRTLVPDPGAAGRERDPHRRLEGPDANALVRSTSLDRSVLLSSKA